MSSARDTGPPHRPYGLPRPVEDHAHERDSSRKREATPEDYADGLARLRREIRDALGSGLARRPLPVGRGRRRELEALRRAADRWDAELERLREGYEALRESRADSSARAEYLERALAEREAELRALRSAAADRELDLQRDHESETRRQQEEIQELERRLREAESGGRREEELREVKRLAYGRERELRRSHAEKLSEVEREAGRRLAALQAQREADNRSLVERHAAERARREEELESLRLRRQSEARAYGERIEELARERAGERTSLEEAVARLREKHEAERARLGERIADLEETLEEQEAITVELLEELGYARGPERRGEAALSTGEIEAADGEGDFADDIRGALNGLRRLTDPGDRLREGLALFNETEHLKVVGAITKSLGEPEVHAALETHGGTVESPVITLVWAGVGWRRYVCEPRATAEPRVYLTGSGEDTAQAPGSRPNARLDGRGCLALGVRPL